MTKLLIIGLDGGSFDLIHPWVQADKLPNFKRLLAGSTWGALRSTIPPMTFPGWSALLTGKNPGKHGIFDFTKRRFGSYEVQLVNAGDREAETFWRLLSNAGKRVASIGVPVTYPPEPVNGVMISGFDAPVDDARLMYPPTLYEELEKAVGRYIVSADFMRHLRKDRVDGAVNALCQAVARKGATASYLLGRERWDCFMIVFGETDAAVHHFWRYHDPNSPHYDRARAREMADPILRIYQQVDQCLGRLLAETSDETTIMLVSDHGAGGSSDKAIHLNRWLEGHGLLWHRAGALGGASSLPMRALNAAKSRLRAILPIWMLRRLRYQPNGIGMRMESTLRFGAVDWKRTRAFSEETSYYPSIWINLKGRDPDGQVRAGAEYDEVRGAIQDLLLKWRDPETGERVVKQVFRREEVYQGEHVHRAPDLLIVWNLDRGYSYLSRPSYASATRLPIEKVKPRELRRSRFMVNRSGSHREMGVFALKGPGVRQDFHLEKAAIIDVAPTVLYLAGLPVPKDMDGGVLTDCFDPEHLASSPVSYGEGDQRTAGGDAYTADEAAVIVEKLRDLGYVE